MAVSNGKDPKSGIAGGTIPQYAPVKRGTVDGEVVVGAAITDIILGIARQAATAGQTVPYDDNGKLKAKASGAITRGDRLMFAAGNKLATLAGTTAKICGVADESAADGDIFEFTPTFPAVNDTQ